MEPALIIFLVLSIFVDWPKLFKTIFKKKAPKAEKKAKVPMYPHLTRMLELAKEFPDSEKKVYEIPDENAYKDELARVIIDPMLLATWDVNKTGSHVFMLCMRDDIPRNENDRFFFFNKRFRNMIIAHASTEDAVSTTTRDIKLRAYLKSRTMD